ncbi:YdcF family protein [Rhizobium sp. TRM95111]|uniref:YdcF family protein n=1 Tax=Rhizobium alarense TaxID=2846851 RepID=UPI001F35C6F7|nr:YdcF family protein [Rhizobium alarense]MCF3641012.1 YdcF family protein [Rhizobium alarense]
MSGHAPVGRRWRIRPLRRLVRVFLSVMLLCLAIVVGGFLYFAETVASMQPPDDPKADAIVVLTGGFQRIDQAIELLDKGVGQRLLISGVHPTTSSTQIRKFTQSSSSLFECCIDIGYDALDTIGNANETAKWISDHGYRHVLVVTNNYHMPRSLLELRRSDRKTDFISYPVVNSDLKSRNWLSEPMVMKTMLSEYMKYSLATLRDLTGTGWSTGLRQDSARQASLD